MSKHIRLFLNHLLVIFFLLAGTGGSAQATSTSADRPVTAAVSALIEEDGHFSNIDGAFQGPGGNHGGAGPGGPGGNPGSPGSGGLGGNQGGLGSGGPGGNQGGLGPGGPGANPGRADRRGPGQTNGVGLGGPGGNGPSGPGGSGHFGGLEGMESAGIGGRGGGGGLSGIGPGGVSQPGRDGLGPGQAGPGGPGGIGPGQNGPGGLGSGGLGPGGLEPGTGIGGFLFGNGNFEIPAVPTAFENLDRGAAAQEAAQAATEQGQEAVDQAVIATQEAYEQLWADYYDAVDYAAESYYDAATGAIDYGAETFEDYYNQAVSQAQQTVNSYYDYYDDYQTYTELYPWDSYAYSYDEATGEYVTTETTNNYYTNYYNNGTESAASVTAPISTTVSQPAVASPVAQLPAPSQEAYQAIVVFANDQLGAVVTPVYAGQVTQETLALLASLPAQAQNPVYSAQNMAVTAYYGLLNGGVAALALGDCSEGASCQLSGDIPADVSNVALGTYTLQTAEVMPTTPGDALELIQLVYPKLTGLQFTQAADVPGYAFSATTTSVALDNNGQPAFVTKVVFVGVMDVNGRTMVYATVGLGEAYASMVNPFQVAP